MASLHDPDTAARTAWWATPAAQLTGLVILLGWAAWSAFQGEHVLYLEGGRRYLSPFHSPWMLPAGWPTLLVLAFPLGFRFVCWLEERARWHAVRAVPAGARADTPEAHGARPGLRRLHHVLLALSIVYLASLWNDAGHALLFEDRDGDRVPGIALGSVVILLGVLTVTLYTAACVLADARFRSGASGAAETQGPLAEAAGSVEDEAVPAGLEEETAPAWDFRAWLADHRAHLAWASVIALCLADLYVRMVSMGVFADPIMTRSLFETPTALGW